MTLSDISTGKKLTFGFGMIITIMLVIVVFSFMKLNKARDNAEMVASESVPFALVAKDMKFDSTQVWQWLTDVSATHDRGGFREAEEAADNVRGGLGKFREMFREEGDRSALRELDELEAGFEKFYSTGHAMAEAYVTEGIEAGNALMEEFDSVSEGLTEKVVRLRESQLREAGTMSSELLGSVSTASADALARLHSDLAASAFRLDCLCCSQRRRLTTIAMYYNTAIFMSKNSFDFHMESPYFCGDCSR